VKIELPYLVYLWIAIMIGTYYFFANSPEIDVWHTLFMIFGGVFMMSALIFREQGVKWLQPSNFFLQIAVANVILGIPFLTSTPERIYTLTPAEILIAVTAEEAFRTGAYFWIFNAFKELMGAVAAKIVALIAAAITFACMHMFFTSLSQWVFAFYGGFVLSGTMVWFKSQLSGVVSHWTYDLASLAWISPLFYFIITGLCGLFGALLKRKE
jgi:hypothetical protein